MQLGKVRRLPEPDPGLSVERRGSGWIVRETGTGSFWTVDQRYGGRLLCTCLRQDRFEPCRHERAVARAILLGRPARRGVDVLAA